LTSALARDGALMQTIRAPFSFNSRNIASRRSLDSTTSRRENGH